MRTCPARVSPVDQGPLTVRSIFFVPDDAIEERRQDGASGDRENQGKDLRSPVLEHPGEEVGHLDQAGCYDAGQWNSG